MKYSELLNHNECIDKTVKCPLGCGILIHKSKDEDGMKHYHKCSVFDEK